jgi:hypothetical protein
MLPWQPIEIVPVEGIFLNRICEENSSNWAVTRVIEAG